LNCLKPTLSPFPFPQRVVPLINKMEEQIQEYLQSTVGKICKLSYWHRNNMDVNKAIQKKSFLKLRTIIIGIKLKFSSFIGYF
jgi:hypothetical protein